MGKPTWYLNRLRQMSPAEVAFRLARKIRSQAEQYGLSTLKVPLPASSQPSANILSPCSIGDPSPYISSADSLLQGKLDIFALSDGNHGFPPAWNLDLRTGRTAPLSFGKTLDYRNPLLVGDIKYLWEPNRHLHLVTLAQAWRLSGDPRYLDGLGLLLQSWLEQCPYPKGPNWTSSLELGIRLINWSIVWQLIGGEEAPLFKSSPGKALLERWRDSIYRHAAFIRGNFSRFSSANNHLIGEAAGLYVATCAWPLWEQFRRWREVSYRILVRQAGEQNHPDGVNKEQAISYQQFVIDFLLIAALAGRRSGVEFPPEYWKRIETMMEFLASVMDVSGNVPMIGDGDDGYVVRLSREAGFSPYRSLLATGAVLFGRSDFKVKAGQLDDKTRWLMGDEAEGVFATLETAEAKLPVKCGYPHGGYYILGCHWETEKEVRLIADAGPLGYLSIAAHGHADALAFTLNVAGREILVDPGTYAYHANREWRDYFRSTAAHNTLRVDGEDQSVMGGNFLWLKKADAMCELWEESDDECRFAGSHDGYLRLRDPVRHRREILLRKKENRVVVIDTLDCRGEHEVERFWHFAEHCRVHMTGPGLRVEDHGVCLTFRPDDGAAQIDLRVGQESPPCGWISRRYDEKSPTVTAVFRNRIRGTSRLTTEITWNHSTDFTT